MSYGQHFCVSQTANFDLVACDRATSSLLLCGQGPPQGEKGALGMEEGGTSHYGVPVGAVWQAVVAMFWPTVSWAAKCHVLGVLKLFAGMFIQIRSDIGPR